MSDCLLVKMFYTLPFREKNDITSSDNYFQAIDNGSGGQGDPRLSDDLSTFTAFFSLRFSRSPKMLMEISNPDLYRKNFSARDIAIKKFAWKEK